MNILIATGCARPRGETRRLAAKMLTEADRLTSLNKSEIAIYLLSRILTGDEIATKRIARVAFIRLS